MFVFLVPVYEAIYAYEATDPSDLSFEVGDKILVLKDEGDWWTGRIANRLGTFPNNYVQQIQSQNVPRKILVFVIDFIDLSDFTLVFRKLKKQQMQ